MNIHVILVYDVNTEDKEGCRRLVKIMKICRKYLSHVQRSVFEGNVTEGQLALLRSEIKGIANKQLDFVIIYIMPDNKKITRDIITDTPDPTENFI